MNLLPPSLASSPHVAEATKPDTLAVSVKSVGKLRYSSHAIFAGAREVEIEHQGALYRLRLTSLGKLILTK